MKIIILLLMMCALCGCERQLTPQEIATKTKECHDLGLEADAIWGMAAYGGITQIQCYPNKKESK